MRHYERKQTDVKELKKSKTSFELIPCFLKRSIKRRKGLKFEIGKISSSMFLKKYAATVDADANLKTLPLRFVNQSRLKS